jgi:hypothetical protein
MRFSIYYLKSKRRNGLNVLGWIAQIKHFRQMLLLGLVGAVLWACKTSVTMPKEWRDQLHDPIAVYGKDCVWMVDGSSNTLAPDPMCLSGRIRKVYIGDALVISNNLYISIEAIADPERGAGSTIFDVDLATGRIEKIKVPIDPNRIVKVSDEFAYASVYSGIAIVDLGMKKTVDQIPLDLACLTREMALGSNGVLYTSACESVAAVDTTSNSVLGAPIQFEKSIYDIAVTPNGYLYALHHDSISVVDPIDRRVVTNIKLDQCQAKQLVTTQHGKAFVTCYNKLAVTIDTSSNNILSSSSLPCRCFQIATIHNGNLYLFDLGAENVVVLDAETGELVTEISRLE